MKKEIINLLIFLICGNFTAISQDNKNRTPYDPFKIYTPNINQSIEENDRYSRWIIDGVFPGVFRKKIYKKLSNDTLLYVASGSELLNGFNARFNAQNQIIIPTQTKKIKIKFEYAYCKVLDSELFLKIIFRKKIEPLEEIRFSLPASYELTEGNLLSELETNTPPSVKDLELLIPEFTDNMIIQINSLESKDNDVFASVALKQFDILIDGKKINEYTYDQTLPFTQEEISCIEKKSADHFSITSDVNLIGIGESIHGCKEFHLERAKIIKDLILSKNIRYFGFEIGMFSGYNINQYIQGEMEDNDIEKILFQIGGTFNSEDNIELFRFMRNFNKKNPHHLLVMGFDTGYNFENEQEAFARLLNMFPQNKAFGQSLVLFEKNMATEKKIETNILEQIQNILSPKTTDTLTNTKLYQYYFQFLLSEYLAYRNNNILPYDLRMKRDSLMAKRIDFFYDLLPPNEKIVLCGHLGHLRKSPYDNPIRNRFTFSCGHYLSEKYKKSYFVVGLYAGNGQFYSSFYRGYNTTPIRQVFPLAVPMGKSLEQLCLQIGKTSFYLNNFKNIENLLDRIYYARSIGNEYEVLQFSSINIQEETDAFVFFQNVREMSKQQQK